jgi:glycerophosphoryl diester phosphodiesterase
VTTAGRVGRVPFPGRVPRIFGHRGAAGVAPENTLVSFNRALADGADVLELDVHATADGEIVVLHDPTLERTTDGAGPVTAHGWSEVARLDAGFHFTPDGGQSFPFRGGGIQVPRLADVLRECPRIPLNIEIKQSEPPIVDAVVRLVRDAGARVLLAAELDPVMQAIRAAAPDVPTSLAAGEVAVFIAALQSGTPPVLPEGAVALQIPPRYGNVTLVDAQTLTAAHALGAEVHVWTINDPAEMRRLLALGCDGLMSDFPDRARAVIAEGRRS